jgi:hypothetical protein
MPQRIRILNGVEALNRMLEEYKRLIYNYNSLIAKTGYYLKPVHIVVKNTLQGRKKYVYIGRYWWKIEYAGKKGSTSRVRWIYIGKEKPKDLIGYPDPPYHPLIGLSYIVDGKDVIIDVKKFEKYRWVFEGYKAVVEE